MNIRDCQEDAINGVIKSLKLLDPIDGIRLARVTHYDGRLIDYYVADDGTMIPRERRP